ncbi:hypothetical protein [Sphingobacterium hungaricum]|uniref:Lipoprotein n=1 Tax=Sphingobacterium hungaricum TaxID=2082723 RepID=A0A928UX78_9SPHI|nr:hypothetical protein [Sphingobacterium hungaricum]MBE8712427.1 hypothetical protein [Sphingobacterium hungaricum]
MRNPIILLCLLVLSISCNRDKSPEGIVHVEPIENLNIQTMQFSEIDSSGILIFPLKMGENKDRENDYLYKEMPHNGYWNVLFYNTHTSTTHLLTENKVLILNYDFKYNIDEGISIPKKLNHIFYEVRTTDFNSDSLLNAIDPIYLFVSDKEGKKFRKLSPEGYNLNNWAFIESSNKIILTATKDSNKNLKFDDKDEVSTFEVTLDVNEDPIEIFSADLKTKLKTLYDRDWKRIN